MHACNRCGTECEPINQDFGIGGYECGGAPGRDVQMAVVSNCCETDMSHFEEEQEAPFTKEQLDAMPACDCSASDLDTRDYDPGDDDEDICPEGYDGN